MARLPHESPLAAGRVAEVYGWGDGRVVKLWRSGGRADAEQEARAARAAAQAGVPTPEVFDVIDIEGRAGIVFEHAPGPTMVAALLARPWRSTALAGQMADLQARLHNGPAVAGLPSAHAALAQAIARAPGLTDSHRSASQQILASLPAGDSLCHGDLHPDNILMSPRGPLIVDWANAVSGPPAADVARTLYLLGHGTLPVRMPVARRLLISGLRVTFALGYRRRYAKWRPLDRRDLERWAVPVAAARLSEGIEEENHTCLDIVRRGVAATRRT